MSIVSSTVTTESAQRDARFWVHELHTDNIGLKYPFDYLANAGTDFNAKLAARATTLAAKIAADEINTNIIQIATQGSLAVLTFNYTAAVDQLPFARAAYVNATQMQAIMTGDFLSSLTNGQLQTIFSMTAGQVTTLRANKLTPAANAAASIRAASGA
jgi:hypothetical protein